MCVWTGAKTKGHKGGQEQKSLSLGSSLYRFTWFCSMSNNGYWFGDPRPFIPTSAIGALHGQQSAVLCLSSKCGKDFPQKSLVFALLRGCADLEIKVVFNGRFQGQAGPSQIDVSRHWRKIEMRHSKDGFGLPLPGAPFGNFWFSLRHRFG